MPFRVPRRTYALAVTAVAATGVVAAFALPSMVSSPEPHATPYPVATAPPPKAHPTVDPAAVSAQLAAIGELQQFGAVEKMELRNPVSWYRGDSLLGAQFELILPRALSGTFEFIVWQWVDGTREQPYDRFHLSLTVSNMQSLFIALDMENGRLAELTPGDETEITAQGSPVPE